MSAAVAKFGEDNDSNVGWKDDEKAFTRRDEVTEFLISA